MAQATARLRSAFAKRRVGAAARGGLEQGSLAQRILASARVQRTAETAAAGAGQAANGAEEATGGQLMPGGVPIALWRLQVGSCRPGGAAASVGQAASGTKQTAGKSCTPRNAAAGAAQVQMEPSKLQASFAASPSAIAAGMHPRVVPCRWLHEIVRLPAEGWPAAPACHAVTATSCRPCRAGQAGGAWGFGQAGRAWGLCVRHMQHAACGPASRQGCAHVCVQVPLSGRLPRLQRAMIQLHRELLQHHVPRRESGRSGPAWPGTRLITAQGRRQTTRWARECGLLEVASSVTAPARMQRGQSRMLPKAAGLPIYVGFSVASQL